ncbi:MAG: ATP-binding protein [Planctomycetaceae bacterium]|nr:ATP-binding protein [Planctomycetaceae bacterium]
MAATDYEWGFYGRREQLGQLRSIVSRGRFFFLRISGRRRIGKTSLVHEALQAERREQVLYIPTPDSDPAGVVANAREFLESLRVDVPAPTDLRSLAASIGIAIRRGYVVALDEFQYFSRKVLYDFNSYLQTEVDALTAEAAAVRGGLIVLGSIHTEMSALLEDRDAPLFNRVTDTLELGHLDIESVLEILRIHSEPEPERLLFLWNLFEGVPKFYRDGFEQGVLAAERREVLKRLFFSSASPLRSEAENWFLRELRGRYDLVLKYIARHPGCTNGEIDAHASSEDPSSERQVGGYLKVLRERYQMVEQLKPIFAKPTTRNSRYYISDNFLRSWLSALATPAASITFRPVEEALAEADARLVEAEGHGLERLVGRLYEERSRKRRGGFPLSHRILGYWDSSDTEIDLVALNEPAKVLRLATCKRTADRVAEDLSSFDGHTERFLRAQRRFSDWRVEKVAITVRHTEATRRAVERRGCIAEDLIDLTRDL